MKDETELMKQFEEVEASLLKGPRKIKLWHAGDFILVDRNKIKIGFIEEAGAVTHKEGPFMAGLRANALSVLSLNIEIYHFELGRHANVRGPTSAAVPPNWGMLDTVLPI